jgi:hypothetical protein
LLVEYGWGNGSKGIRGGKLRKGLLIGFLTVFALAGCGGSGGGSSNNFAPGDRSVDLQVLVTDSLGNIQQSFVEDDISVTAANENATLASHVAAIINDHLGDLPADSTLVISDFADLNVSNYPELTTHPEFTRYPRLIGDPPFDDPIDLTVGGELQQIPLFGDVLDLEDAIARIMQYLTSEVAIPSGAGTRLGMGRPLSITVYVRSATF